MRLLQVDRVTKRFGGLVANDDVSFNVQRGQIVGLIGPNGAGKTTIFNCIAGYFAPTEGEIRLDGLPVHGLSPETCARVGIARTFQVARTFTSMTACENVMVGALMLRKNTTLARSKALELLEIVGLVGGNGNGKSTTLRAIAGLNRADAGQIRFEDTVLQSMPAHERVGLGLSLVPEGRRLFPRLSVQRNLELGAYTRRDKQEVA